MVYDNTTQDIRYISKEDTELGKLAEQFAVLTFQIVLLPFWRIKKQVHYRKMRNMVWVQIEAQAVDMTAEGLASFLEPITGRTIEILAKQMEQMGIKKK